MSANQADPKRTYALVVGIEKYDAGETWYVDAPASDARRFTEWLRDRGVPNENMMLFLSPLDENSDLVEKDGLVAKPATREEIYSAVTKGLPRKTGDLLYVHWSGHGVITADGMRRLFYADATDDDKRNMDLNSLLLCLGSDYLPGFEQQVYFVDACANFVEAQRLATSLPTETFPAKQQAPNRQQFVIMGARPGDYSTVATQRKTGIFSEEALKLLRLTPASSWPPDMNLLTNQLQERFTELRNDRKTDQTPTYFWYKGWNSEQGSLGSPTENIKGARPAPPIDIAIPHSRLGFADIAALVNGLLACATMSDRDRRETVVKQLRSSIAVNISRNNADQIDVMNIINACQDYPGGITELLEVIRFFEKDSIAMQKLDAITARLPRLN